MTTQYKTNFNETDKLEFKNWLANLLQTNTVTIVFTKKNGEERIMKASLQESKIPVKTSTATKKQNSEVISVVDTDINEWRSIRYDSIKEIKFDLQ